MDFDLKKGFLVETKDNKVMLVWNNRQYGPYSNIEHILEGHKIVAYLADNEVYISDKKVEIDSDHKWVEYISMSNKQEYVFISWWDKVSCHWLGVFNSEGQLVFKFWPSAVGDINDVQFLKKDELLGVLIEAVDPDDDVAHYTIGHSKSQRSFRPTVPPYRLLDIVELSSGEFAYVYQPTGYVEGGKRLVIETESAILKLSKGEKYQINQDSIVVYKKNSKVVEVKLGG
jgi:hypothetical protein